MAASEKPAREAGDKTNSTTGSDTALQKDAPAEQKMSVMQAFMRVFQYGQPIDYLFEIIGILAALGSGAALAMMNLIIGDFVSLLTTATTGPMPDNFMSQVSKTALYFVYIGIARFVATYIYSSLLTLVSLQLTRNLRYNYFRAALSQEIAFFDKGTAGSISMQATSHGEVIQAGLSEKFGQIFQCIATFLTAFIIAFVSQWKLTLICICIVPTIIVIMVITGGMDTVIELKILGNFAQAASFAESTIGSVRTTHAFSLGPKMSQKYSQYMAEAKTLGAKKSPIHGLMNGSVWFIMFSGMGLAFWQGISMIARGEVENIGTVFTVIFSIIMSATTINTIGPHVITFTRAGAAAVELFDLIDRKSVIDTFEASGQEPVTSKGNIELRNVSFSYPTRPDVRVLDDFSLNVPAGKVTALVGASGSGKSTIVGLLERWYDIDAGQITLDGNNIDELNLRWLRTNIRLVQQEPVLFDSTVYENIANGLVGTPWENESAIEKRRRVQLAAQTAFAHDFVCELPDGYDTRIGEKGGLLSGGQKQRIAIARSVISQPKILLLDEATSALDPQSEAIVQKALDEASKDRTTIVIAHKLKTIRNADNIVVMKQGRIIELGQHDELVARDGAYAKLVQVQDLSVQVKAADHTEEEEDPDDVRSEKLAKRQSMRKRSTVHEPDLETLIDSHDFATASQTGLIHTIFKLATLTPEIRMWCMIVTLCVVLGAGVYPGQTLLLANVMDVFGSENMQERGNFISLMFFVMALGLAAVFFGIGWSTNRVSQLLSVKIREDLFQAFLRQDLRFFDRPENTVGALTSYIDTYAQAIFEFMGLSCAIVVMSIVTVVACSILSIVVSWKLGLVGVFGAIPPMLLSGYTRLRIETKMGTDLNAKFAKSSSIASESITAIRTVSSLAIEKDVLRRYAAELDEAIEQSRPRLFMALLFSSFTQALEFFILALGFWWGSKLVSQGEITFYSFFVSFMSVFFSGQGCGLMFGFANSFTKANSAANYYFTMLDLKPSIAETSENAEKGPAEGCSSYEFDEVNFAYPLAPNNRVLKDISVKIDAGQFVAFVGASGCGKSTMISLLERFYDPTRGSIIIDNTSPLSSLNPRLYRSRIALVQQEPTLFPGTIRENIAMGVDTEVTDNTEEFITVNDATIEAACRSANAWDFVSSLPEGLATPCGTSGSQLSGGQRQRIAIARALIRNPSVVLLDEATSALDTESERIVQSALMEAATVGSRITIAVAHRLSTIRSADKIFVFNGGRIAEAGTHDELIATGGMYKKMCEAQSLDTAI